jgi:hypothetical protein
MVKKAILAKSVVLKKQPGLVFYRPAVDEILKKGKLADINAFIKGVKSAKTRFGDFEGLIAKLESAAKKVQER